MLESLYQIPGFENKKINKAVFDEFRCLIVTHELDNFVKAYKLGDEDKSLNVFMEIETNNKVVIDLKISSYLNHTYLLVVFMDACAVLYDLDKQSKDPCFEYQFNQNPDVFFTSAVFIEFSSKILRFAIATNFGSVIVFDSSNGFKESVLNIRNESISLISSSNNGEIFVNCQNGDRFIYSDFTFSNFIEIPISSINECVFLDAKFSPITNTNSFNFVAVLLNNELTIWKYNMRLSSIEKDFEKTTENENIGFSWSLSLLSLNLVKKSDNKYISENYLQDPFQNDIWRILIKDIKELNSYF